MKTVLEVNNLEKYYGGRGNITKAIDGINFDVFEGEFVGIMGASGSGKTTLLNCISTIDKPTAGYIYIDGVDITKIKGKKLAAFRRNKLGFIFQDYNLLDTLNGFENIAIALSVQKEKADEIEKKTRIIAELLGITEVLDKYPYQMSGGQRQRIASARAIVTDPTIILADEPTGALDSKAAKSLLESLSDLNNEKKSTIMMVTHDAYSASYCSRILFLRDGKVFNELVKGEESRNDFFNKIMEVIALLGGDLNDF